jgi:glutamine amidotransferase-like uncharacterized protein
MDLRDGVIFIILAALLVFLLIGTGGKETPIDEIEHVDEEDLTVETRVAIYSGQGTWNESVVALERLFLWMNLTVELVDAPQINGEGLEGFDIFCVPGGDMYQYSLDISPEGKEKIKEFVLGGGGYLGVCGGAYFAGEEVVWRGDILPMTPLGLYRGTATGPDDRVVPYPGYNMCDVEIMSQGHPITANLSQPCVMLYYWGPVLVPREGSCAEILGVYGGIKLPAMLAIPCGSGRVFLVGCHPEIEEDSLRDGSTFAEELDDRGSDWELLQSAVLWLEGH